jgi:hypothetical protein
MNASISWQLSRNSYGRLVFVGADGESFEGVVPVTAFPISAPGSGVALLASDGRELAWIVNVDALPAGVRELVATELASREFMPEIARINKVSSFATPSNWTVATNRGEATFVLRGEEDIRRIGSNTLLIADSHGIQFLIRDLTALDIHSRKLLDRFL